MGFGLEIGIIGAAIWGLGCGFYIRNFWSSIIISMVGGAIICTILS